MKLPSISALSKAIAEARRIYRRGNYGRVYVDLSLGRAFVEEFVSPDSYVNGPGCVAVDVWLEKRSYECASMNLRRLKACLENRERMWAQWQ